MRINPIGTNIYFNNAQTKNNYNKKTVQPTFGAVLLKDNLVLIDGKIGKSVKAALIELELDARELIADRRYRHRDLIPDNLKDKLKEKKDEIIKFLDSKIPTEDFYTGDFQFLGYFANRKVDQFCENPAKSMFNNALIRNQYPNMQYPEFLTMKDCWEKISKRKYNSVFTDNGHGLLRKELADYITNSENSEKVIGGYSVEKTPTWKLMKINEPIKYSQSVNTDSLVYNDKTNCMRQRILMLVGPKENGNYRYLAPDTKVYGAAEIYTDRTADIIEDILKEKKQQNTVAANSIYKRLGIKSIKPTQIKSFLAPLMPDHMNGYRNQKDINTILDINDSEDAAKILLDNIESRNKLAGTGVLFHKSRTGSIYDFFTRNSYEIPENNVFGDNYIYFKNGFLKLSDKGE